jgi:hypothetical protein
VGGPIYRQVEPPIRVDENADPADTAP